MQHLVTQQHLVTPTSSNHTFLQPKVSEEYLPKCVSLLTVCDHSGKKRKKKAAKGLEACLCALEIVKLISQFIWPSIQLLHSPLIRQPCNNY